MVASECTGDWTVCPLRLYTLPAVLLLLIFLNISFFHLDNKSKFQPNPYPDCVAPCLKRSSLKVC